MTSAPTNPVVDAVALKPCPFCAGRAYSYFRNMGWAQCVEENDCSVHPAVCADTEAEAITAWNTRQSADAALVEALEWLSPHLEEVLNDACADIQEGCADDLTDFAKAANAALAALAKATGQ